MLYSQNIDACLSDSVGPTGLDADDLDRLLGDAGPALQGLRAHHRDNTLPLLRLPERTDDIAAMEPVAERFGESFDDVVVLGTGGSSLGGRTLVSIAPQSTDRPGLHFMDNVDPVGFERLFQMVDPKRTGFLVISKSGGTAETLTQFLYCLDVFRNAMDAEALSRHFLVITEPKDSPLSRLATTHGFDRLDHDPGIGGRFSVLSNVGLLPAMIGGLDAEAIRAGAAEVLQPILKTAPADRCAPAVGAALAVGLSTQRQAASMVVMPYLDLLADFGLWYRQLWAESLGKEGKGTTPINALGTVDQHSQLQLYLAGPRDKMFTLIFGKVAGTGGTVATDLANDDALGYLAGRRMGDLLDAEQRATAETLIRNGCPTRILSIRRPDEQTLGALMMHFMLETIIAAGLLKIDPFDQPAVEEGKILARDYLSKMPRDA